MLSKRNTNKPRNLRLILSARTIWGVLLRLHQCVSESLHLKNKQNFKGMTQKEEHIAESGSLKDRIMAMPHDGVLFRSVKKDFENREQMFSEILKKKLGV